MNSIDDNLIRAVLTTKHPESTIRLLDWHMEPFVTSCVGTTCTPYRLKIRYECDQNAPVTEVFFVKLAIGSTHYENLKLHGIYEKETYVYTKLLPQMHTIDGDRFIPEFYYADENATLFLEDLSQTGHKFVGTFARLDFQHCFFVLRCLARFHALSVKLDRTVGIPDNLKQLIVPDIYLRWYSRQRAELLENLPQHIRDKYPNIVSCMENVDLIARLVCLRDATSDFKVLNHGDLSMKNVAFQYDEFDVAVKSVKLIDFQSTLWASPTVDLIYFVVKHVKYEVYAEYFPLLMNIYVDTLNGVLRQFDCPGYDMQTLLNDIDALHEYAMVLTGSVLVKQAIRNSTEFDNIEGWLQHMTRTGGRLSQHLEYEETAPNASK